jgi:hypothetical protein
MRDKEAGVLTSQRTLRMQDSICLALDQRKCQEITATVLTDSGNLLVELWGDDGEVIGQYIMGAALSKRLRKSLKPDARRARII